MVSHWHPLDIYLTILHSFITDNLGPQLLKRRSRCHTRCQWARSTHQSHHDWGHAESYKCNSLGEMWLAGNWVHADLRHGRGHFHAHDWQCVGRMRSSPRKWWHREQGWNLWHRVNCATLLKAGLCVHWVLQVFWGVPSEPGGCAGDVGGEGREGHFLDVGWLHAPRAPGSFLYWYGHLHAICHQWRTHSVLRKLNEHKQVKRHDFNLSDPIWF